MVTKMARNDPQFNLRVPSELKQKVENAAKESGRSINAEAVYRLEQSFLNDFEMPNTKIIDFIHTVNEEMRIETQSAIEEKLSFLAATLEKLSQDVAKMRDLTPNDD